MKDVRLDPKYTFALQRFDNNNLKIMPMLFYLFFFT